MEASSPHNATASHDLPNAISSTPRATPFALLFSVQSLGTLFLLYAAACYVLRFRFERRMRQAFPQYTDRASMAAMTSEDAQKILSSIMCSEFPFVYKTSLQFAIVKTYGFETMSRLMVANTTFTNPRTAPKRYEDTTILFAEFTLQPPTSERCIQSIARINYLHSRYKKAGKISNEDFLYTLAVCVTEPIRFINQFEWRTLNDMEVNAIGAFWKSLGDAMDIEYKGYLSKDSWKDGIEFAEDITAWAKNYEVEAMRPAKSNRQLCDPLLDMLIHHVPGFLKPFAAEAAVALMGDRLREAFLHPEPSLVASTAAFSALLARRFFMRYLALPRFAPKVYLSEPDPKTGRIQHYDYLVQPFYQSPTFWNRWGPIALYTRLVGGFVPGPSFIPEGYLFEEVGPKDQIRKGAEAMREWQEKIGRDEGRATCPFSK